MVLSRMNGSMAVTAAQGLRLLRHGNSRNRLRRSFASVSSSSLNSPLEWSYLHVPGKDPLMGLTLGQMVDRADHLFGDREAVVSVHEGIRKTFSQVKNEAEQVAAGLTALGLQRGDRLGIWGTNNYHWYITQMAAAKAGLVLVNVNPAYQADELLYCINKVGIKALVCDRSFKASDYYSILCSAVPETTTSTPGHIKSSAAPYFTTLIVHTTDANEQLPGAYRFNDLYEAGESSHLRAIAELNTRIQPNECANIQFTSGTTGTPKGAMLSHHNLVNNAHGIGKRTGYDESERRICVTVPLFHCFGCVAGTLSGSLFGATCVFPSPGFDADEAVKYFHQERYYGWCFMPTRVIG